MNTPEFARWHGCPGIHRDLKRPSPIISIATEVFTVDDLNPNLINLIRITGRRESEILQAQKEKGSNWEQIERARNDHDLMIAAGEHHTRQKAIQDPVHGAILLEPWELDLVSSWEMLRLRYVMQLGPAHIVYPGATHTRFLHCIGTNFLAQKCIHVVNYCNDLDDVCFVPLTSLLDGYQQKVFRASALLHDVGHPPTSHTIEFAIHNYCGLNHLDLGVYLIEHSGLKDILETAGVEPRVLVDVLKRRTNDPVLLLISDFLDSPLDIDKTDYLIRDAYFSGVQLGVFPAERVLLTNRVVKTKTGKYVRSFMIKALHSLEALILSRNWMFSDLYIHHAVKLAEALLSKATYYRLKEEGLTKNECVGMFTRMTDTDLYQWLLGSQIPFVREYVNRILYRRLFKVAVYSPLYAFSTNIRQSLIKLNKVGKLIETELELGGEPGNCIIDIVIPNLGDKYLREIPLLVGGGGGMELVSLSDTEEGKPLTRILMQQKRTIPSVRVYCKRDDVERIKKRFYKMFPLEKGPQHREDDLEFTEY